MIHIGPSIKKLRLIKINIKYYFGAFSFKKYGN